MLDALGLRPVETLAAMAAASEAPPAAAVAGIYGTASIIGQTTAGVSQIAQAFSGNFSGDAYSVEQAGNILAGPATGLTTWAWTGGNADLAEKYANRESTYTAGVGLVDKALPTLQRLSEFGLSVLGLTDTSNCHQ